MYVHHSYIDVCSPQLYRCMFTTAIQMYVHYGYKYTDVCSSQLYRCMLTTVIQMYAHHSYIDVCSPQLYRCKFTTAIQIYVHHGCYADVRVCFPRPYNIHTAVCLPHEMPVFRKSGHQMGEFLFKIYFKKR